MKNTNELILEKSPYLLQHAHNPVQWRAWNAATLQTAKQQQKLIFLSIGYSTCHWCHVMERESFEDEQVAALLNQSFICIKVDREELPDVDHLYMETIQRMGLHGGWPLNMFLTPERVPFYGGTYFPKQNFVNILQQIAGVWQQDSQQIQGSAQELLALLQQSSTHESLFQLEPALLDRCYEQLQQSYDHNYGGFSSAPKFPTPMKMSFLLRYAEQHQKTQALPMVEHTLMAMACGGIFDQLGGGFARYATDIFWLAPHFEKMLYDQAGLVIAYTEAYQLTHKADYAAVAKRILDYVLRVLTHPEGGFYCGEDADSEGEEGKFYVWRYEEIENILTPEEFARFVQVYDLRKLGNFEHGQNILMLQKGVSFAVKQDPLMVSAEQKLFLWREQRVHPHLDDKILTSWNGFMIKAFALATQVLDEPKYLQAAEQAVAFIKKQMWDGHKLYRRWREGEKKYDASVEDFAFFIAGLLQLYQVNGNEQYLLWAQQLQSQQNELFWDEKQGGYFFAAKDDAWLLLRQKDAFDNAMPSANSMAAMNLIKLFRYDQKTEHLEKFKKLIQAFQHHLLQIPVGFTEMMCAVDVYLKNEYCEQGFCG